MSKERTAYKYRLYPTKKQCTMFAKTFGCCRKAYNLMLGDKIAAYQKDKSFLDVTPAGYKKEYSYLAEVDSLALANEQMHLTTAYKNFFEKRAGFPKFKSKKDYDSYTTNEVNNNIKISRNGISLPKIGIVKAKVHRNAPDGYKLKSVTVSRYSDNTYYASVLYEYSADIVPVKSISSHIGLDYKSNGLYVDSTGYCATMPHFYRESQEKLSKVQRKLSRKKKGSSNYNKQKQKVAKVARHIANQRNDFLQKKSTEITNQYDLISVEDLNMKGMSASLHLGKATMDNGYGKFLCMLEYKQHKKGHYFVKVDKCFPSSQLCQCGYKNPVTKDLSVRTVTCPVCGATYDRDDNAAINVDKEGLRIMMAIA